MTDAERLLNLTNAFVEDILSMSDEEILAEAQEDGEDPAQIAQECRALYGKVSAEILPLRGGGTQVRTKTGKLFDLLHPTPEMVDIRDIAAALAKLCRFNGHTQTHYSVAQHSVLVAELLPAEIRAYGLFHDAKEAYIGDKVSPVKTAMMIQCGTWMSHWNAMEARIDAVIYPAFGLIWPVPPAIGVEVRRADHIALATEGRDLMTGWQADLGAPLPLKERIVPQPWTLAMERFLNAYSRSAEIFHE